MRNDPDAWIIYILTVPEVKSRLKNEQGQAIAGDPLQPYLAHFLFHNRVTEAGDGSGDVYVTGNPFDTEKYLEGTVAKGVKDFSVFGAMRRDHPPGY